jgi:hypothetical protein
MLLIAMNNIFYKNGKFDPYYFRWILIRSLSSDTSYHDEWSKNNPSSGHCYVISEVINDMFENTKFFITDNHETTHWFYKINNEWFDFSSDQYGGNGIKPINTDRNNCRKQNLLPQKSKRAKRLKKRFRDLAQWQSGCFTYNRL